MKDCIFCKIINKEIPNYTLYEDDFVLAFLDIFPRAKGHAVIIPKTHLANAGELTDSLIPKLFGAVLKVREKISKILKPDAFNIGWNDGSAAGQTVPHLHIHILPRWEDDGGGSMQSIVSNSGGSEVKEIFSKFN